jgi:pimeloyl-ACP methyl ester carboxylesterase
METSADPEPPENVRKYKLLNFVARWFGLSVVAGRVMPIMFGQKFLNDPARAAQREEWKRYMLANDRIGITRAVMGSIDRNGVYDEIEKITAPTLIIVGDQDVAVVPAKSERIHARIPNSKLVIIPGAGHTSCVEEPQAVKEAIISFLNDLQG